MSVVMEERIKRWTARRKSALLLEIVEGKRTIAEASRQFDLMPSEIESWEEDGKPRHGERAQDAAGRCRRAVRTPAQGSEGSV